MNITTSNVFTDAVLIQSEDTFDISISGTFSATVVVQRSKDGTNWRTVESFTAPVEKSGRSGSAWYYRVGVPSGGYTSGTVVAEIYG
ncbi:hypothetical protein CO661_24050 [Sinorhizobium fredii]|uniref:Uncharacterized protein n=1 Tax=Rhizobium fredii TaxID=380 RepID=A0A2A6LSS6_RHIFR|nr:hypothetical protein [Sinorhizobium fredii]PDT45340.1 hypothetical protein CO661_24050 [Sinorhizobium fredii]